MTAEAAPEAGQVVALATDPQGIFPAFIDDGEFLSPLKALKLEQPEGRSCLIMKRIAFPETMPYDISLSSFAITTGDVEIDADELDPDIEGNDVLSDASSGVAETGLDKLGLSVPAAESPAGEAGGTALMTLSDPREGCFYIYSFDGRLLAEYDVYGECLKDYIYMGARLVAEFKPATAQYFYYTQDQIGSTRVVTNDAGAVVYAEAHDPYGGIQKTWVNNFEPKRKFSDKERDEETDLDYFGARYFASTCYRWISVDPVLTEGALYNPQEWNLYLYCKNNPLAFRDSDGKAALPGLASLFPPPILNFINQVLSNYLNGYISAMRAMETLICGRDFGMERWIDTPYDLAGKNSSIGIGGDCSGIPYHAIRGAGYPYVYVRANADFVNSTKKGGVNFGLLSAIPKDRAPQVGDVGYWNGHLCVYACNVNGVDYVYNASSKAGKFQLQKLEGISAYFGTSPIWYRLHRLN